jgi:hypothetical protein
MRTLDSLWPTPEQALLLRVCLLDSPDEARAAWKQWKARVDLDDLDHGSFRLIPLLYRRVLALEIEEPDLGRLKGIYRYQWTKRALALRGKASLLGHLQGMGFSTLLLKGAALGVAVYPDPVTRPLDDVDFMVSLARWADVLREMERQGWHPVHPRPEGVVQWLHACGMRHADHGEVDVHGHLFRSHASPRITERFWERSAPLRWENLEIRMLCPEDQFLHSCEHGVRFCRWSTTRWLADCRMIFRSKPGFDWDQVFREAERCRLQWQVRETLACLEGLGLAPAEGLRSAPAARPMRLLERLERHWATSPPRVSMGNFDQLGLAWCYWMKIRGKPGTGTLPAWKEFQDYAGVYLELQGGFFPWLRKGMGLARLRFRNFLHGRLPGFWRGLRGARAIRAHSIGNIPEKNLQGFHFLEADQHGDLLRWSGVRARVYLDPADGVKGAVLMVKEIRPLQELQSARLQFRWNGRLLAPDEIAVRPDAFEIKPREAGRRSRVELSWTIEPFAQAVGDPRPLGLPVFAVVPLK